MDPFLGEIRLFGLNYAPRGWALCLGQLMAISQNTALFSLLGTQYGGDGRVTFGLPNLSGRAAVGAGQGPGLAQYYQGEMTGTETETLLPPQLPLHTHTLTAALPVNSATNGATSTSPAGAYYAKATANQFGTDPLVGSLMAADIIGGTTGSAGNSEAHTNQMPFLVMNYAIALEGVFPQRP